MIEQWLKSFEDFWIAKDIDGIMCLFDEGVEYWETPHGLLKGKKDIEAEWKAIEEQSEVILQTEPYISEGNKHTVKWSLSYINNNGPSTWAGLYLITLNEKGLCDSFYQVGEKKND
jgi:hypothetical protein